MRRSGDCGAARPGLTGSIIGEEMGSEEGPSSTCSLTTSLHSDFTPTVDLLRALTLSSLSSAPH